MRPGRIDGDMTSDGGVGRDGFERGYRDPIRLLVASRRRRLRVSPTQFCTSSVRPLGLAVFDGERRRYAFQRHPQNQ